MDSRNLCVATFYKKNNICNYKRDMFPSVHMSQVSHIYLKYPECLIVTNVSCIPNGSCVAKFPLCPNAPCVKMSHVFQRHMATINHIGGQSYLLPLITKSIDTTYISCQPSCCGRKDIFSFCLHYFCIY